MFETFTTADDEHKGKLLTILWLSILQCSATFYFNNLDLMSVAKSVLQRAARSGWYLFH